MTALATHTRPPDPLSLRGKAVRGRHRFRKMDKARMQAAFADMFDQWVRAKEQAKRDHPEWSPEQVDQAVSNAFRAAMRSVG